MLSNLDSVARSLIHINFIMRGIDYTHKVSYVTPYISNVDPRKGKQYFKKLRYTKDGETIRLDRYSFTLPSPEVLKQYEEVKGKFTTKLVRDIIASEEKPASTINKLRVVELKKEGVPIPEIAHRMGCTKRNIHRILKEQRENKKNN